MRIETLLSLLQFSDGLFPAGGYAHSFGLETLISDERVTNAKGVAKVLRAHLEGNAGPCDAVYAVNALQAAAIEDIAACVELDTRLDAIKSAAEARAASRQLGRQTLRITVTLIRNGILSAYAQAVEKGVSPGHQAIIFGIIGGAFGWPAEATAAALLYTAAVGMVGAATRLVPLGQTQAQRLTSEALPMIASLAEEATKRTKEQAFTFAPTLEIAAMRHARLEARLFRS
jgi:urease accessory protein